MGYGLINMLPVFTIQAWKYRVKYAGRGIIFAPRTISAQSTIFAVVLAVASVIAERATLCGNPQKFVLSAERSLREKERNTAHSVAWVCHIVAERIHGHQKEQTVFTGKERRSVIQDCMRGL